MKAASITGVDSWFLLAYSGISFLAYYVFIPVDDLDLFSR